MNLDEKINKAYFSISEVAEICELKPYVLRYWEKEFHQIKPQKNNVGVRRYSKSDIEIVLHIKDLLYDKQFTIKGAKAELIAEKEKRHHMIDQETASIDHSQLIQIRDRLKRLRDELND